VAPYTTALSTKGFTFLLNLTAVDQATAQQTCQEKGGHLAAYTTTAEQAEVEAFYVNKVGAVLFAAASSQPCIAL
jgi:hypothetical protein